MKDFTGKIVLITGAGKGSGCALAKALAKRGAIIAANDISPVNVEAVVDEIIEQDGRAKAYIEDVAKKVGVQNLVNQVEDDFGRIDILINHASVQPNIPLLDMDEWDWHRVLDVNVTGAFLMMQSVGRVMRNQKYGVMINLIADNQTSVEDDRVEHSRNEAAFVASMYGLDAFTHQAARELNLHGIRIHAVKTGNDVIKNVFALLEEE